MDDIGDANPGYQIKGKFVEVKDHLNNKENRRMYRRIAMVTFPAFIELLLTSMFGAVDTAMVGQLGPAQLGGVGLTSQPFSVLTAVFSAVNVGVTTLISWAKGEEDSFRMGEIVKQSLIVNFFLGIMLTFSGVIFAPQIISFIGGEGEMVRYGITYMRMISYGIVFEAITMSITAALRGVGETKLPMVYNLLSNFLNVFLNWVFIYGNLGAPALGVYGAGLATAISKLAAAIGGILVIFVWKDSPIMVDFREKLSINIELIKEMMSIGLPAAGESLIVQSALMIFTRQVAGLGTVSYAAHQIALQVNRIVLSISSAFQVSTTALVGQALGAEDYELVERYVSLNKRVAQLISMLVVGVLIAAGDHIARIFTNSEEVVMISRRLFIFVAVIKFFQSVRMTLAGALRGAGDTVFPLIIGAFGSWVLRVGLTQVFAYNLGLGIYGAWCGFLLDQFFRYFVTSIRYNNGKWKEIHKEYEENLKLNEGKLA